MSNQNGEPFADLIAAQAEMKNAVLNRTNPHFKSKYADLTSVREATLPALTKYGLGILQKPTMIDGRFVLISRLIHKSGVVLEECEYPLSVNGKPQAIGSEITYARRYTWAALCGISADEDDDANAAQDAPRREQKIVGQESSQTLTGPHKSKTALQQAVRAIVHDLEAMTDVTELDGLLLDNAETIAQIEAEHPDWWDRPLSVNNDFEGLKQRIERIRARCLDDVFPGDRP